MYLLPMFATILNFYNDWKYFQFKKYGTHYLVVGEKMVLYGDVSKCEDLKNLLERVAMFGLN